MQGIVFCKFLDFGHDIIGGIACQDIGIYGNDPFLIEAFDTGIRTGVMDRGNRGQGDGS